MRHWHDFDRAAAMASPWRRRRVCLLTSDEGTRSVALRQIDGRGARIDLSPPLPIGTRVEFHHPEAGSIAGRVGAIDEDGVMLRFDGNEAAVAFALAAIAADMTRDQG